MAGDIVVHAAELLKRRFGRHDDVRPPGAWLTLVRVVLESGKSKIGRRDWSWLEESPLRGPGETALQTASRLEEIVGAAGLKAAQAKVLPALAEWWLRNFDDDACADFGARPLESWQRELRAVRGVNWELADRILLAVGGLAVYPLDRGSLRIAARHGWIDMSAEYDEWQALFVGGLRDSGIAVDDLSDWNSRVAGEFCRAKPDCEACPLKGLLPAKGPLPLMSDE
jgi:endonuclease-3 related protein